MDQILYARPDLTQFTRLIDLDLKILQRPDARSAWAPGDEAALPEDVTRPEPREHLFGWTFEIDLDPSTSDSVSLGGVVTLPYDDLVAHDSA
jgi:hypothetical protein